MEIIRWFSPLRYPGGKGKLYKKTSELLRALNSEEIIYVEPYAGGAGLALELLFKGDVSSIVLNDYDISIYAFWHSILNNKDEFVNMIINKPVTIDEWYEQKSIQENKDEYYDELLKLGFSTFFLNRTNRSGIIKGGVLGGKNQDGKDKIDCRYNKDELIERINRIYERRDNIIILNNKAEELIIRVLPNLPENSFIFFDPPYYKKGPGLYTNFYKHDDHVNLEVLIRENVKTPYIITYDNNKAIELIYSKYSCFDFDINYSAQNHKLGSELLIFNQLLLGTNKKIVKNIFT